MALSLCVPSLVPGMSSAAVPGQSLSHRHRLHLCCREYNGKSYRNNSVQTIQDSDYAKECRRLIENIRTPA